MLIKNKSPKNLIMRRVIGFVAKLIENDLNKVVRVKDLTKHTSPPEGHSGVFIKANHMRLIMFASDTDLSDSVEYRLEREVAPTEHHPKLMMITVEEGVITDDNILTIVDGIIKRLLKDQEMVKICAIPYHIGDESELRWFKISGCGVNGTHAHFKNERGDEVTIPHGAIAQGFPSASTLALCDTQQRWWFFNNPSRSLNYIQIKDVFL